MNIIPIQSERVEINPESSFEEWVISRLKKNNQRLQDGDVLVISSKILSYFEGGVIPLKGIQVMKEAEKIAEEINQDPRLIQLVLNEADEVIQIRPWVLLTKKNGIYCANAGVDTSNVKKGYTVVWPKDSFASAKKVRRFIIKNENLKNLAVMVIDSAILPGRKGTLAVCLGHDGIVGVENLVGEEDLYGNILQYSSLNIVDSLATSTNLLIGEGNEARPMAIVRDFTWEVSEETKNDEMLISSSDDMFPIG